MNRYKETHPLDDLLQRADQESYWNSSDKQQVYQNVLQGIGKRRRQNKMKTTFKSVSFAAIFILCVGMGYEFFNENGFFSSFFSNQPANEGGVEEVSNSDIVLIKVDERVVFSDKNDSNEVTLFEEIFKTSIPIEESQITDKIANPPIEVVIHYVNKREDQYHFWTDYEIVDGKFMIYGYYRNTNGQQYYEMKSELAALLYTVEGEMPENLLESATIEEINNSKITLRPTELIENENLPDGYKLEQGEGTVELTATENAYFIVANKPNVYPFYTSVSWEEFSNSQPYFVYYFAQDGKIQFMTEIHLPEKPAREDTETVTVVEESESESESTEPETSETEETENAVTQSNREISTILVETENEVRVLEKELQENAHTQGEMNDLMAEIHMEWDQALNEIYGVLKNQLSPEEFIVLREEQRNWIEYRDQTALEEARKFEGGSMYPFEYSSSLAQLTLEQCYELDLTYNYKGMK